jgi:hypothetical protein
MQPESCQTIAFISRRLEAENSQDALNPLCDKIA